jgi:3-oxoacyl-ACP reductase-like protein
MAEETKPTPETPASDEAKAATPKPPAAEKPPAAAKKPKEPAIEDKPFTDFMQQHFTPALKEALAKQGLEDVELKFAQEKLPLAGAKSSEQCWQIIGNLQKGKRQFNLYFVDEDINGKKANGGVPSIIESFMIDERKSTLDLLLMYTLQRLNGQKWLSRN